MCAVTAVVSRKKWNGGSQLKGCIFGNTIFEPTKKNIESKTWKEKEDYMPRANDNSRHRQQKRGIASRVGSKFWTSRFRGKNMSNRRIKNNERWKKENVAVLYSTTNNSSTNKILPQHSTQNNRRVVSLHHRPAISLSCVLSVSGAQYNHPPTLALNIFLW